MKRTQGKRRSTEKLNTYINNEAYFEFLINGYSFFFPPSLSWCLSVGNASHFSSLNIKAKERISYKCDSRSKHCVSRDESTGKVFYLDGYFFDELNRLLQLKVLIFFCRFRINFLSASPKKCAITKAKGAITLNH